MQPSSRQSQPHKKKDYYYFSVIYLFPSVDQLCIAPGKRIPHGRGRENVALGGKRLVLVQAMKKPTILQTCTRKQVAKWNLPQGESYFEIRSKKFQEILEALNTAKV